MTSSPPPMRSASAIVESVTREVVDGVGFNIDLIQARALEFARVAGTAPAGTLQNDIAQAVAHRLAGLSASLTLQRFSL